MQKSTIISLFALILAIVALIVSLIPRQSSEVEIDKLIDAGLQRKEQQYVQILAPKMERIYKDMIYPYTPPAKPPETLGELFLPVMKIFNSFQTDTPQQPQKAEQGAAANPRSDTSIFYERSGCIYTPSALVGLIGVAELGVRPL